MRAVKYFFSRDVYIEDRDPENRFPEKDTWAITKGISGMCMNRDREFEYEPLPSNRDDTFFARCRFSLEEARTIAWDLAPTEDDPEGDK